MVVKARAKYHKNGFCYCPAFLFFLKGFCYELKAYLHSKEYKILPM